jgi:hypothetical protein
MELSKGPPSAQRRRNFLRRKRVPQVPTGKECQPSARLGEVEAKRGGRTEGRSNLVNILRLELLNAGVIDIFDVGVEVEREAHI